MSCRASRRRRTARVRRPCRPRSPRPAPSGTIANDASWAMVRMRSVPMPAMRRPFSTLEWACEVAYATSSDVSPSALTRPPVARHRADRIATSVASLAEPWITPPPVAGRAESRRERQQLLHPVEHQRLDLGARRRRDPAHALDPEPGRRQLAEDRGVRDVGGEVGEELRMLPMRQAGHDDRAQVVEHRWRTAPARLAGAPATRRGPRPASPATRPVVARCPRGTR